MLSPTQRVSVITLLCKDATKAKDLNSWRPISLLNVDYKIISKALANRIKKVADRIIGEEQTAGIYNRTIFDTLHLIRNVGDYCRERKIPCVALSFDQAKAFDRMDQKYLLRIMKTMGFGKTIRRYIKLLYTDIYSTILLNGFLTEVFKVTRSMRQLRLWNLTPPICDRNRAIN
jgi:hypothetical protein